MTSYVTWPIKINNSLFFFVASVSCYHHCSSPVVKVTKAYETVTLRCAARGSPVPSLEWSKDGEVISTNTTSKTAGEVKGELVVPRFSAADQGVYKCFFKNYDNGTVETSTTLGNKYEHS